MARIDRSAVLAAERQEPYTAAEHAAAEGHQDEYARDIPRTCTCIHQWNGTIRRYERVAWIPACPWHSGRPQEKQDSDGV